MTPQATAGANFGLGIFSSAVAGFGKYESGKQQEAADNYNADITLQNTANKVQANKQQLATLQGRQATAYAGAGVDIASGSPLLIMAATAARGGRSHDKQRRTGSNVHSGTSVGRSLPPLKRGELLLVRLHLVGGILKGDVGVVVVGSFLLLAALVLSESSDGGGEDAQPEVRSSGRLWRHLDTSKMRA